MRTEKTPTDPNGAAAATTPPASTTTTDASAGTPPADGTPPAAPAAPDIKTVVEETLAAQAAAAAKNDEAPPAPLADALKDDPVAQVQQMRVVENRMIKRVMEKYPWLPAESVNKIRDRLAQVTSLADLEALEQNNIQNMLAAEEVVELQNAGKYVSDEARKAVLGNPNPVAGPAPAAPVKLDPRLVAEINMLGGDPAKALTDGIPAAGLSAEQVKRANEMYATDPRWMNAR